MMARHRVAQDARGPRPSPVRIVGPSSRHPYPHWIRTRFESGTDVHPVHGLYAFARWTPELIAEVPAPRRRLRRRDRRSIRRARNVDIPA
ncbi:hypothetical protein SEA_ZENTENO07_100 [Mycobacterium phage Zenteno07]|nr:hypothetical protein SEA_ZENTENO07_100 [Mycobacterium phage Zenteno07]